MVNYDPENQNKTKEKVCCKKSFVGVTEKYIKTEESLNTYDGKLSERN